MKRGLVTLALVLALGLPAGAAPPHRAVIDAADKRQTIEGFGTCLISWGKVPASGFYDDHLADIYAQELGLNILRVNIAPWGYPRTEKAEDISWRKIDLNDRRNSRVKVFIDFARKLKKRNPDLRLIGTVWSPPAWMKLNHDITGGRGRKKEPGIHANSYRSKGRESRNRLNPKYYAHFCKLLVEMCKLHKQHGVPFYAISPGNEVMFSQEFESCVWTARDYAVITGMLGEALDKEGFGDVLLFGPETMTKHNWNTANPLYIKELRANPVAWKHFDRFATHGYVDGFKEDQSAESSLAFWRLIRNFDKPLWMTEGGTGEHDWPKPLHGVGAGIHNSLVAGNASAWVPWQIASGAGEKNGHALMAGRQMTKKTQVVKHYTRWIDAGAVRLQVREKPGTLRLSAFMHARKHRLTVIAINPGAAPQTVELTLRRLPVKTFRIYRTSAAEDHVALKPLSVKEGKTTFTLPRESIVTLVGGR